MVEEKLMQLGKFKLAKAYILYREKRSIVRQANTTDESILNLVQHRNKELDFTTISFDYKSNHFFFLS